MHLRSSGGSWVVSGEGLLWSRFGGHVRVPFGEVEGSLECRKKQGNRKICSKLTFKMKVDFDCHFEGASGAIFRIHRFLQHSRDEDGSQTLIKTCFVTKNHRY